PPQIHGGPVAVSPSISSVTIKWKTNEPADARVRYALNSADVAIGNEVYNSALNKDHDFTLSGLEPDTTYYYWVEAVDSEKNGPSISSVKTFKTLKAPDTKPPKILSGPSVVDRNQTAAIIEWETDEPATSEVEVNGVRTSRSDGAQKHRVQVTGLTAETTYSVKVISTDAVGNTTEKNGLPFTTPALPDVIPPEVLEGPSVTYKSDTQATVAWKTDEPATGVLTLWPTNDPTSPLRPASDGNFNRDHSLTVSGLTKGTNYAFRIESSDASGNTVVAGTLTGFASKPGVVTKLIQPPGGGGSFFTNLQPDSQFPVILSGPYVIASTANT
ncbi:MAG: fibronectin type III domain-containing protein, partial [Candidatus Latescibacterota bacterium]